MPGNNIAEIVLRVTTEGTQNAQVMANQLNQVDQAARQLTTSTLSATTAQRACTAEVGRTHSQLAKLLQDWGDLERQVDHFSATTLRNFSTTSASALTEWIEGSGKARDAFRGFVTQVIEGLIQMMIQQGIAHAIGLAQTREAGAEQAATNAQITASAAPAAATQAAATFGANAAGVLAVVAVIAAAIGILAATRHAEGGPIFRPGHGDERFNPRMVVAQRIRPHRRRPSLLRHRRHGRHQRAGHPTRSDPCRHEPPDICDGRRGGNAGICQRRVRWRHRHLAGGRFRRRTARRARHRQRGDQPSHVH